MMVAGSLTALGTPASAAVAQILTSIPVTSSEGLEDAMKAAVNDVLDHAIALVPTVVDILLARR